MRWLLEPIALAQASPAIAAGEIVTKLERVEEARSRRLKPAELERLERDLHVDIVLRCDNRQLRETIRVEGVMKTKTSEGKAQAVVIAGVPVFFGLIMNFNQAVYPDVICHRLKAFQQIVGQDSDNQKHCVSTGECSLINLDLIDGKILSQNRPRNLLTDQREVIQVPLKEFLVGQDRDAVCPGLIVDQSGTHGVKVRSNHTGGGRGLLDFADEPECAGTQRFAEATERTEDACPITPVCCMCQPRRDLFALMGDNLF